MAKMKVKKHKRRLIKDDKRYKMLFEAGLNRLGDSYSLGYITKEDYADAVVDVMHVLEQGEFALDKIVPVADYVGAMNFFKKHYKRGVFKK